MTYGGRSRGSDPIDHHPVSVTSDPRRLSRYRELSQLLDEAAERLERQN